MAHILKYDELLRAININKNDTYALPKPIRVSASLLTGRNISMNKKALANIITLGEGFTTEFKKAGTSGMGREICAFVNAIGGIIYIGKDNAGKVIHLPDYAKLMEDIPNKIRNAMGVIYRRTTVLK